MALCAETGRVPFRQTVSLTHQRRRDSPLSSAAHEGRSHPHRTRRGRPQASRGRRRSSTPTTRRRRSPISRCCDGSPRSACCCTSTRRAGHGLGALRSYAALAAAYPVPTTLECVVACQRDLDARVLRAWPRWSRRPGWSRQTSPCRLRSTGSRRRRAAQWPDVSAAGRSLCRGPPRLSRHAAWWRHVQLFTELNRKRVPAERSISSPTAPARSCTPPTISASCSRWRRCPSSPRSVRAMFGDKALPYRPVDHCHAAEPLWQRDQGQSCGTAHRHGRSRSATYRPVRGGMEHRLRRGRCVGRAGSTHPLRIRRSVRRARRSGRTCPGGSSPGRSST